MDNGGWMNEVLILYSSDRNGYFIHKINPCK